MPNDGTGVSLARNFVQTNESDRFYEDLLSHGAQWGVDDEFERAVRELESTRHDIRTLRKFAELLSNLLRKQQLVLGETHLSIARTEMLLGMCYRRMRVPDAAVKSLRSAVTRFQNSEDVERDMFVACLVALSGSYRDATNYDASRTCIKQVYRLLPPEDAPLRLQCAALEELAADLLAENRFKSALEAYERLVAMKTELLKTETTDIVRSLMALSTCHFALHQIDAAESVLIRAGQYYHYLRYDDRALLGQLLESLGGTLRHKAQFMQADILEEVALEVRGGSDQVSHHLLYGSLVSEAQAAEARGDQMTAKGRYREALSLLESQRQKRVVDRLNILAKLLSLTSEQQVVQRSSLFTDIEDSVQAIFCGVKVGTRDGLERIALLYDLCGKTVQSANLRRLAGELMPKVVTKSNAAAAAAAAVTVVSQTAQLYGIVEISLAETVPLLSVEVDDAEEL
jgi:tetratricopeptide (TPR) repeat protein